MTRFVDRTGPRAALAEALDGAAAERERRTVFVLGEAGIGKTRLVSELAQAAHARGSVVLAGRCDEELDLPYQPFAEALEHLTAHAPPELLRQHVAVYGDSIARLVPALRASLPSDSAPTMPGDSDRYLLYSAVEGLLEAAVGERALVLVLEDLHWADLPTLLMLRRLLTSPRASAMVVIGTARTAGLAEEHPLRQLLADLHREPLIERFELEGLKPEDVGALLRDVELPDLADGGDELARSLTATTNGNPFFVTELVRSLVETRPSGEPLGRSDGPLDLELPSSVTETLARRIGRLGPETATCLRAAAAIGNEFEAQLLGIVAERESVAEPLDTAVAAGLLAELPGRPGSYRFAHALVARHLYSELGSGARIDLHRRIAVALERRISGGAVRVADLARHWLAASTPPDYDKAIRYTSLAGDEASATIAPDEACRWYEVALDLVAKRAHPSADERCELLIKLGEAERQAGRPAFRTTLLQAADLAQKLGDRAALVRAVLSNSRGLQSGTGETDLEKIEACDAALASIGEEDSGERARLLAMKAVELTFSDRVELRFKLTDAALAIARRLDDPFVLSSVLNTRFLTIWVPDTHAERLSNTLEALAASEASGELVARFYANHQRIQVCIEAGELDEARRLGVTERQLAEHMRWPTALWYATSHAADLAMIDGDLAAAEALANKAFQVADGTEPDAFACYTAQLSYLFYEGGRLGEFVPMLEQVVDENPGIPGFRSILALALLAAERVDDSRRVLRIDGDTGFQELARDVTFLSVVCIFARVAGRVGDAEAAELLYRLLEPFAPLIAYPGFAAWGPVALFLGELATARGDLTAAERHLRAAAERGAQCRAPVWSARADLELGRLHLHRGDATAAAGPLAAAAQQARRLGLKSILADLETLSPERER